MYYKDESSWDCEDGAAARKNRRAKEAQPRSKHDKPNKRMRNTLEYRTEKESTAAADAFDGMLRKISAASGMEFRPGEASLRPSRGGPEAPVADGAGIGGLKERCEALGLKFVPEDATVMRLFVDPFSVPKGTVFHIKDTYIDCDCELIQVLNKSRLMYVFRMLPGGGVTTYIESALREAAAVTHAGAAAGGKRR